MLALVHYLEDHHIGFDKSVSARLHHLAFREVHPNTIGEVWSQRLAASLHHPLLVDGARGSMAWSDCRIEGVTTSTAEAAQMIVTAFTRAFIPDPVAQRRAMREWAMTETYPPQPGPHARLPAASRWAPPSCDVFLPASLRPYRRFTKRLVDGGYPRFSRKRRRPHAWP